MEIAFQILEEGCNNNLGFTKERFERLVEASDNGKYIFEAGIRWNNFDFEIGQKAIEDLDKNGTFIILAGKEWKEFNHNSALKKIEELQPEGYLLFKAKLLWNLSQEQKTSILSKDTGMWAYAEYKMNLITKEEALSRNPNIKWQRKIERLSGQENKK